MAKECPGCDARDSMIEYLKLQNKELQEKLISLVPDAMERYSKLKLTEMTTGSQMNGGGIVGDGMIDIDQAMPDESDDISSGIGDFFSRWSSSKPGSR